jgi:glucokinase
VDERYRIVHQVKFKTEPSQGKKKYTERLQHALKDLARHAATAKISLTGAGVASAGVVNPEKCTIRESRNIVWLQDFPIGRVLKTALKVDCMVGNDVQLALYGEHQLGVAEGLPNVLGVFFGTGVGGAAILDGKLYHGSSGLGGQVGSILTHQIGGAEGLESHGTLDRIASKAAVAGAAIGMGVKQWAPHLFREAGTDIALVTWGSLARARKAGDKQIDDLIRSRMHVAGIALSSIVNFLNPDMLVLGGGLTEEMPRLIVSALENGLREYLDPGVSRKLKVKAAKFGNKAGVIGAARLVFTEFQK